MGIQRACDRGGVGPAFTCEMQACSTEAQSKTLQAKVVEFVKTGKPFTAIRHGPLVLARAIDPATGKSVLHGRRTACLPGSMERTAYRLTAWKVGRYDRTSPAYVEAEVRAAGAAFFLRPDGVGPARHARRRSSMGTMCRRLAR